MDIRNIIYGILIVALLYNILYDDNIIEHAESNTSNNIRERCIYMFSKIVDQVKKLNEYDYLCQDANGKKVICTKNDMEGKICKSSSEEVFDGKYKIKMSSTNMGKKELTVIIKPIKKFDEDRLTEYNNMYTISDENGKLYMPTLKKIATYGFDVSNETKSTCGINDESYIAGACSWRIILDSKINNNKYYFIYSIGSNLPLIANSDQIFLWSLCGTTSSQYKNKQCLWTITKVES